MATASRKTKTVQINSVAHPGSLLDVLHDLAVGREPNVAFGADVKERASVMRCLP